ncbi:MAG: class I SAM-dependent methyltransferase [Nitrospiraceae bacterium]|nr:class I SAM-dependent methyltransferase [Nitrospira sp.]MDW7648881.1 class I SAM-dependent methyltransferase [Nitrospiraceae bacterium]PHX90565.1 MAG: SAM-dependent methyltransferase [Nitrospirota bacterium]MBP0121646.1 class I SAM-dependent methyltransferase [Nitrospira sp.]MBP0123732.1 class I SAM-dependent methyltransferase [Nitrospira sp.]
MNRILEPELMEDDAQAQAYAEADFSQENQGFVDRFRTSFPDFFEGHVLDLGCGPGDIPIRFARAMPGCLVIGVDASAPMVQLAEEAVRQAGLSGRITFLCERFQAVALSEPADAAISNSLLHHVPNPLQFWHKLRLAVKPGSPVLVMDLLRPESPEEAQAIVDLHASKAPDILRRDFYNSLLAAFTEDEVAAQLAEMNLSRLMIDVPDGRHWVVGGLV